jgi:hypothetical protein
MQAVAENIAALHTTPPPLSLFLSLLQLLDLELEATNITSVREAAKGSQLMSAPASGRRPNRETMCVQ